MLAERCIRRRFYRVFLAASTLMSAFYGLLLIRTGLSRGADATAPSILGVILVDVIKGFEVIVVLAAPAAMVYSLMHLRRSGILTTCAAAGFGPGHLRRTILVLALVVAALEVLAQEAGARIRTETSPTAGAWRIGDLWGWVPSRPPGDCPRLILFGADTLDVSMVASVSEVTVEGNISCDVVQPLCGNPVAADAFRGPPASEYTFRPAALSTWLRSPPSRPALVAFLLRILVGPCVLVVCAYVVLLVRWDLLHYSWIALLLLVSVLGTTSIVLTVLLRRAPDLGSGLTLGSGALLLGVTVLMDRRLSTHGLRPG